MQRLRYLIEFIGIGAALMLVRVLPQRSTPWLAARVGDLLHLCLPKRRQIAEANIKRAGITTDEVELARIVRASFWHYGLVLLETFKAASVLSPANQHQHVTSDFSAEVQQLLDDPDKGLILASAHLGNWEIAAQLISQIKPVTGITREMSNPYIDRLFQRFRPRHRFTLISKQDADGRHLIQALKRGQVLALMIDQHAGPGGAMVEFFGHPASTDKSTARLHLITGTPLCFGYCKRTGPMSFHMKVFPPIQYQGSGDREKDVKTILEALNRQVEDVIRESPEQYLWTHRRWREM